MARHTASGHAHPFMDRPVACRIASLLSVGGDRPHLGPVADGRGDGTRKAVRAVIGSTPPTPGEAVSVDADETESAQRSCHVQMQASFPSASASTHHDRAN